MTEEGTTFGTGSEARLAHVNSSAEMSPDRRKRRNPDRSSADSQQDLPQAQVVQVPDTIVDENPSKSSDSQLDLFQAQVVQLPESHFANNSYGKTAEKFPGGPQTLDEICNWFRSRNQALFKVQSSNDRSANRFVDTYSGKNRWHGDVKCLNYEMMCARKFLSSGEFRSFVIQIEAESDGFFSHIEDSDGSIKSVKIGSSTDGKFIFRESWTQDQPQHWNDYVIQEFFNAGPERIEWNGNAAGLKRLMPEIRSNLTYEEFKSFVQKLEEETSHFIRHKETAAGWVYEVTVGLSGSTRIWNE